MIFLSHNYLDKPVVEQIALVLRQKYGQQSVFYDSWSIQPGQGIIDKMEEGLSECKHFFFFVSHNSLTSELVKLEWQNMLMRAAKKEISFIPIRLDGAKMPVLLTQTLYIDLYSNGLDIATQQIIDVIEGNNTYRTPIACTPNIRAYKYSEGNRVVIECHAEYWIENKSSFMFCTQCDTSKIQIDVRDEMIYSKGIANNQNINDKYITNCIFVSIQRAISPGFPLIIEFSSSDCSNFDIEHVLHERTNRCFKSVLMVIANR